MNDIEIYGMKVNDIKDVREVLAVLYAIQEEQKEISKRQADVMQNALKLDELVNKLDDLLSRVSEIEKNLDSFVSATKTVNQNITITHGVSVEVLDNVRKVREEISSLVESSRDTIKVAEKTATVAIRNGVERIMEDLKNKIASTVDDAVKEVSEKVGSLSTVVNVKVFVVSIVLGIAFGYVLYHLRP